MYGTTHRYSRWPGLLVLSLSLALGACAHDGPGELSLSASDVPQKWEGPIPAEADIWPTPGWWRAFGSNELDTLIDTAQRQNLDLAAAAARVLQAEAQERISGSALLPTVGLSGGASQSGPLGGESSASERRSFSLDLGVSYELDFWGKNRANLSAAQASLAASRFDRETVALTVTASVATTYFEVLSLRDRLATAQLNVDNARRVLSITQARVEAGDATPLELAQQRSALARQEANLPGLQQQERESMATLAILLGRPSQGFAVAQKTLAGLKGPLVAPGLPSGLLARRPDIRRAESTLVAASANIEAARAAFYPQISLSGSGGVASTALSSLLNPTNLAYTIAASIVQSIFDGGQREGQFDLTVARRQEILANYRTTVITAFSEVDVALSAVSNLAEQERLRQIDAEQAAEALRIAEARYRAGVENFISVLDAQRTSYSAQDSLSTARLARLQAAVTLFRVLGGGWTDAVPIAGAAAPAG